MKVVNYIQFDREERKLFGELALIVGISYPTMRDAALTGSQGFPDDDPHRKVLGGLARSKGDPVRYSRLELAHETLVELRTDVELESRPEHWALLLPGHSVGADALIEARTGQLRKVRAALGLIEVAMELVGPESDADDEEGY